MQADFNPSSTAKRFHVEDESDDDTEEEFSLGFKSIYHKDKNILGAPASKKQKVCQNSIRNQPVNATKAQSGLPRPKIIDMRSSSQGSENMSDSCSVDDALRGKGNTRTGVDTGKVLSKCSSNFSQKEYDVITPQSRKSTIMTSGSQKYPNFLDSEVKCPKTLETKDVFTPCNSMNVICEEVCINPSSALSVGRQNVVAAVKNRDSGGTNADPVTTLQQPEASKPNSALKCDKDLDIPFNLASSRSTDIRSVDSGYHSSLSSLFSRSRSSNPSVESFSFDTQDRHCVCPPPSSRPQSKGVSGKGPLGLNLSSAKEDNLVLAHDQSLSMSWAKTNSAMQSFSDVFTDNSCSSVLNQSTNSRIPSNSSAEATALKDKKNSLESRLSRTFDKRSVTFSENSSSKGFPWKNVQNCEAQRGSQFLKSENSIPLLLLPSKVILQLMENEDQPQTNIEMLNEDYLFGIQNSDTVLPDKKSESVSDDEQQKENNPTFQHQNKNDSMSYKSQAKPLLSCQKSTIDSTSFQSRQKEPGFDSFIQNIKAEGPCLDQGVLQQEKLHVSVQGEKDSYLYGSPQNCGTKPSLDIKRLLQESKKKRKTITVGGEIYNRKKCIGAGGSAKVYEAEDSKGNIFAIKVVQFADVEDEIAKGYLNEVNLLWQMKGCPHVVQLYQYELRDEDLYLVMEKGDSDLSHILKAKKKLERKDILSYWSQMLHAVNAIHKAGIIHLDLKPSNFLLANNKLKLIDFGIANKLQTDLTSITRHAQAGTINYMAPEQLSNANDPLLKRLSPKTDIWSLACILYCMIYQTLPYKHIRIEHEKIIAIKKGQPIKYPPTENEDLVEVLKACLSFRAKDRPSIDDLLRHPCLEKQHDSQKHEFPALPKTPIRKFASQLKVNACNSPRAVAKIEKSIFRRPILSDKQHGSQFGR